MNGPSEDAEARRLEALAMRDGPLDPARLAVLLADEDWRVRKQAAEAASEAIASPGVVEILVEGLLQADDVGLRNAAVEALVRARREHAPRISEALLGGLARASRTARKFVAAALVGAGEGGIAPLTDLVRDPDVMTASSAVEALAALARRGVEGPTVEAHLVSTLSRPEPVLRLAALDGLNAIGARVEARALRSLLDDPITRPSALRLLARARTTEQHEGVDAVTRLLLATIVHPRSAVEAWLALARRSGPDVPLARRALIDPRARAALVASAAAMPAASRAELALAMRARPLEEARAIARLCLEAEDLLAITAIVELGARAELDPPCREALFALGARAIPSLLEVVRAQAVTDVRAAAWALEVAGELASLQPIAAALEDELRALSRELLAQGEEVGARAAAATLARFGDAADARSLAARVGAHGTSYEAVAVAAVDAIVDRLPASARGSVPERVGRRTRSSKSMPPVFDLRSLLASEEAEVRASALDALVALDTVEMIELVGLALTDEDERVEVAAVRALARVRDPGLSALATSSLLVAARSEIASVRAAAVQSLALLGAADDEAILGRLATALTDASPRVVIAALRGMTGRADPRLEEGLDAALRHADPEVVKEALSALPTRGSLARSVERARALLEHEHWSVRVRAVEVLGSVLAMDVSDPAPRDAAHAALAARMSIETDDLVRRSIALALEPPTGERG